MGSSGPTVVCGFMSSIVPSLLAGDFARLGKSLDVVQDLGISAVHIDVMDGHFRPQISVGQPVVRSIRKASRLKLDVHLMIERPERYIEDFVKVGADSLAFHLEAVQNVTLAMNSARKLGTKTGVAVDATTPLETCYELLEDIDFVLVETGRETIMPRSLKRITALAKERAARGLNFSIGAEGEFGAVEANDLLSAGADILVVGSVIFDKKERGEAMRSLARNLSQKSQASGQEMGSGIR